MPESAPPESRPGPEPGRPDPYQIVQSSPEFQALRRRFRRFVLPLSALFLVWYAVYVLLADYAHGFMSTRLGDSNITVGLLFGLGQFVSTFAITTVYVRWANRRFDPAAERLRRDVEEQLGASEVNR
ncbi:DUF485 domain-containing protein [Kineococcus sp. SYSU DK003]|uniref:DUF485 domain-containing protein n=1 Tax=Kineococcus sp. SYSU DK003 TaxID=3383124 RepID=UPI003D7DEE55